MPSGITNGHAACDPCGMLGLENTMQKTLGPSWKCPKNANCLSCKLKSSGESLEEKTIKATPQHFEIQQFHILTKLSLNG